MTAENVNRAVVGWLDTLPAPHPPLFVYVHYIDVHGPYLVRRIFERPGLRVSYWQGEMTRLSGKPADLARDMYDGALRYVDDMIGQLVRELGRRGVLEDSILIVTSDHGEEFGDHGGHGHGHTLYDELLHVPLIVGRSKAFPHTGRIDAPVSQVDLFPTLTELLRLRPPAPRAGVSFVPLLGDGAPPAGAPRLLAEMDNRDRPHWNAPLDAPDFAAALLVPPLRKYIVRSRAAIAPGSAGGLREELYDLATDPGEQRNLVAPRPALDRLRALAVEQVDEARAVAVAPGTAVMDNITEGRLRALGYVR
jgi:arylsulfatase A-like enzyme